jgi:hypothetical protein
MSKITNLTNLSDWLAIASPYQSISISRLKKLPAYKGVAEEQIELAICTAVARQYCFRDGDRLIKAP